ncbi:MAG: YibE/F family protein [Syntrophomonadaceae bacterium]|jgi:uncharacterized membrane protein|nr:YibE/F family protein [Syntrophomonadaceae bacterium]
MKFRAVINRNTVFFFVVTLAIAAMIRYGWSRGIDYSPLNTDNISFMPGRVTEVVSDLTEIDEHGLHRGRQDLQVELLSGARAGEVIDVRNTLSIDHSVYVTKGQKIVVYLDQHPGESSYFATVQSYERTGGIYTVIALFLCLLAAVGGKTGLRAAFGLIFTFVVIIFLLIPLIIRGAPPVWLSLGLIFCIIAVSLISTLGFTKKTCVSILGTGIGVVFCCVFFVLVSNALHITGYNVPEIDTLIVVEQNTNIKVGDFLFVGILISSLGAVLDVSVSVASSVSELSETDKSLGFNSLFRSGMRIGRDIIGATANTLIMAFVGAFFVTLIMFRIYHFQFFQLINLNEISIELLQAVASASALILCAPVTAFIAARMYGGKSVKKKPVRS